MDLSRYAARLNSVSENTPGLLLPRKNANGGGAQGPGKFDPSSVGFSMLPAEPEDARLTGGTRSLSRRLLGLNLTGRLDRSAAYKKRPDTISAA
jgi:hypothetical protein